MPRAYPSDGKRLPTDARDDSSCPTICPSLLRSNKRTECCPVALSRPILPSVTAFRNSPSEDPSEDPDLEILPEGVPALRRCSAARSANLSPPVGRRKWSTPVTASWESNEALWHRPGPERRDMTALDSQRWVNNSCLRKSGVVVVNVNRIFSRGRELPCRSS